MNTIKCYRCKGLGQFIGIGAIMRECNICNGKGKVEAAQSAIIETAPAIPVVPVQTATISAPIVAIGAVTSNEADVKPNVAAPVAPVAPVLDAKGREIIFAGYDNDVMEAVLAEPRMAAQEWKEKYRGIPGVVEMGLRERASIRELYALSRPVAPRKVNLLDSQDRVASSDAEYMKQVKKEELKASKGGKNG